jgi:NNP family nitrate/nitrite transporter-like MFS transporter
MAVEGPASTEVDGGAGGLTRPVMTLFVAGAGYGLTFLAWTLAFPHGRVPQPGLDESELLLLAAAAVVVGSFGRVPVGVLTDRFGSRVLFPALSLLSAVAVVMLTVVDPVRQLVIVVVLAGVSGAGFVVGCAAVVRAFPADWRGFAVTVFGAGMGVATPLASAAQPIDGGYRNGGLLVLAAALAGYAVLTGAVFRDRPTAMDGRLATRRALREVVRLPATRQLSGWYAMAFGGLIALAVYSPGLLTQVYGWGWHRAAMFTAGLIAVAALGRPVGGWLCRSRGPATVLGGCFAVVAALLLVLALTPSRAGVAAPLLLGLAAGLGIASGVVQGVLGATAPPFRAGTIAGAVGAAGGLAGLIPVTLLVAVHAVTGSHGVGLALLASMAVAATAQLRRQRWTGAMFAFPVTTVALPPGDTVVATVPATPDGVYSAEVVQVLGGLAISQELVVVAGGGAAEGTGLVNALRRMLPRHTVIAVAVGAVPHQDDVAVFTTLLNDGAVAIALTTADPLRAAHLLADAIHADQVLDLSHDASVAVQPSSI